MDHDGNRAVVVAIREVPGGLAWAHGGSVDVAKVAVARDLRHARSIGPYSLVTQQPLSSRSGHGGQPISAVQLAALAGVGEAPWTAWELLTLKSDSVTGRLRAYEDLVRGHHPGPERATSGPPKSMELFSFFTATAGPRAEGRVPAQVPEAVQVAERELAALGLELYTDDPPLQVRWLTSAEIRERSHGEVKRPETINYRTLKPEQAGLFCARIFGPVRDYECSCGKYRRMKHRGVVCETCGVEVIASKVRRERQGHVELAVPVPHPWRLAEVGSRLGLDADAIREVIAGEADLVPGGTLAERTDAWEATGPALAAALAGTDLMLDVIPVLPPDLRPLVPLDGGRFATSDLNDLYRRVVNRNNRLRRLLELDAPPLILRNEYWQLFEALDCLFDNGSRDQELTGPDGRPLRSLADMVAHRLGPGLLHKRTDHSAITALSVDPELEPEVCRIPVDVASELFKPWAYALLEAWGHTTTIKASKRLVERRDPAAMHAIRLAAEQWPVLLATETGLAGCRVELGEDCATVVSPGLAEELDSESVHLFVPLGSQACTEVRALQGFVLELPESLDVEISGWLSALVSGTPVRDALLDGVQRADPVVDPTIRAGLGWWPGEPPERVEWIGALPDGSPPSETPPGVASEVLGWPVHDVLASVQVIDKLAALEIHTIGELVTCTEAELLRAGLGRRELLEVLDGLATQGLSLGSRARPAGSR